ncbi:MAG: helix-hairpin-helix domain-containing protein [Pseudomonadota bacterium]
MKALAAAARLAVLVVFLATPFSAYAGPVNVNTADAETLASELEGVGITKARAIVAYRNANGPFTTADALAEVTGIGSRTIEINRANILLEDGDGMAKKGR